MEIRYFDGTAERAVLLRLEGKLPVDVAQEHSTTYADFDTIHWDDFRRLGGGIKSLVAACVGIDQEQLELKQFLTYRDGQAFPGVDLRLLPDVILGESALAQLTVVLSVFLARVTTRDSVTLDLFEREGADLDSATVNIVQEGVESYLLAHGGKAIGTPMRVEGSSLQLECSGKYAPRPPVGVALPIQCEKVCVIDGLQISERKLYLLAEAGKFCINFDEGRFYEPLYQWLRKRDARKIHYWEERDAKGSAVLTLQEIGELVTHDELFT